MDHFSALWMMRFSPPLLTLYDATFFYIVGSIFFLLVFLAALLQQNMSIKGFDLKYNQAF